MQQRSMAARTGIWMAAVSALALGAAGCAETGEGDGFEPPPEGPVPYVPTGDRYAPGPFGIDRGEVIGNAAFETSFVDSEADPKQPAVEVRLSDFYNPTGDEVYPEGTPFEAGTPKPKLLLVAMAARWCLPCRKEAEETLPEKYAELAPKGAEFMLVLAEGAEQGVLATEDDLRIWTKYYPAAYVASTDEDSELGQYFNKEQFPANMVIDTSTMVILQKVIGAPEKDSAFWKSVEDFLE